jgi:disulfide bond formation protein DsbB
MNSAAATLEPAAPDLAEPLFEAPPARQARPEPARAGHHGLVAVMAVTTAVIVGMTAIAALLFGRYLFAGVRSDAPRVALASTGEPGPGPRAPAALAPAAAGSFTPSAIRGEARFKSTCAACHGADAKGLPNLGKDLTTSKFVAGKTSDQLVAFIKKGRMPGDPEGSGGTMPPKGGDPTLSDNDLKDVAAFIRMKNSAH